MSSNAADIALYNTRTPGAPEQPKPTRWEDLVLLNGWANMSGQQIMQWRVDAQGNLWLRGVLDPTAITSDVFGQIPTVGRPLGVEVLIMIAVTTTVPSVVTMRLTVGIDGFVTIVGLFAAANGAEVAIRRVANRYGTAAP